MANVKKLIKVDGAYVLEYCHKWCRHNHTYMTALAERLGHSGGYIQKAIKNGFPVAELELLCSITKLDKERATTLETEKPKETPVQSKDDISKTLADISRKLDALLSLWGLDKEGKE